MNKKGGITGRGLAWEILNSWWIAFSFVGFSWIGFFIIGNKGKQKKWLYMGVAFFIMQFVSFFFIGNSKYGSYVMAIWLVAYVVGIIVSFRQRKKYLLSRDILINASVDKKEHQRLRDSILRDFEQKGKIDISKMVDTEIDLENIPDKKVIRNIKSSDAQESKDSSTSDNKIVAIKSNDQECIDINHCTELDLVELAGLSVVSAKQAIQYRKKNNGFHSAEEFYDILELKPHLAAQLEKKITCGVYEIDQNPTLKQKENKNSLRGRKLDF